MNLEEIKEKATAEGIFRASQHNMNRAEAGYNAKWFKRGAIFGAELQAKTMYSEEDMKKAFEDGKEDIDYSEVFGFVSKLTTEEWFEKIKNK